MKGIIPIVVVSVSFGLHAAVQELEHFRCRQEASRLIVADFRLSAPAVVTADVQTNRGDGAGLSIGYSNFANMEGAVNKYIAADGTYTIRWKPWQL